MATKKTETPKKTTPKKITAKVINGNLNVRQEASLASAVIRVLDNGAEIEVLKKGDDWCQIADGFVMSEFLTF